MLPPSGDAHIWLEMEGLLRPQVAAANNPRPYPSELDRVYGCVALYPGHNPPVWPGDEANGCGEV